MIHAVTTASFSNQEPIQMTLTQSAPASLHMSFHPGRAAPCTHCLSNVVPLALQLDCGQGPPEQVYIYCNPARERWAGIVPSGDGDGVFVECVLPATAGQTINDTRLFESLVPQARLRGCVASGKQQGVSRL